MFKRLMSLAAKYKRLVLAIVLVILILVIAPQIGLEDISSGDIDEIVRYVPSSFPLAILVFIMAYVVKALVMVLPVFIFYIAAGLVFPRGWAIAITYFCLIIEVSIGYLIGRGMGEEKVEQLLARRPKIMEFFNDRRGHVGSLCFLARLSPIPFELVSMFFGAVKMPFWRHVIISLIGVSPVMIPNVISGNAIHDPLSARFLLPFGISLAVSTVVFIIFQLLTRRKPGG